METFKSYSHVYLTWAGCQGELTQTYGEDSASKQPLFHAPHRFSKCYFPEAELCHMGLEGSVRNQVVPASPTVWAEQGSPTAQCWVLLLCC